MARRLITTMQQESVIDCDCCGAANIRACTLCGVCWRGEICHACIRPMLLLPGRPTPVCTDCVQVATRIQFLVAGQLDHLQQPQYLRQVAEGVPGLAPSPPDTPSSTVPVHNT